MRKHLVSTLVVAASMALLSAPTVLAQDGDGQTASPPTPAAEPGVSRFAGTWSYSGSHDHGTQIISRAVDHTVEPMNIFVRAIAAGRLRGKNQLVQRIVIAVDGDNIRVEFDGNRTYRGTLGQWRQHTFDGEAINVQFRYQGGALVQLFRSEGGTRRNVYRIMPDGRLRLEVTVQSSQLPRDMHYQLLYRR